MKIRTIILPMLFAALPLMLRASDSKRTAEYLLSTPFQFEGKEVTLDVAFVKPVHWKSPISEIAFFHAITLDRLDHKPGGEIMVVIPSEDAAKFSKKFGASFEGRNESNSLKGIFTTAPGGRDGRKVWLLDTTGKIGDLVKQNKLVIEDGERSEGGPGGPGGPGPWHPHGPR